MFSLQGKRVLKVMPSFPYPESGAEQIDRASGIRQLTRLGAEVSVIAKVTEWADRDVLKQKAKEWGVRRLSLVGYKYSNRKLSLVEKIKKHLGKLAHPLYLDGAAYEFTDPEMRRRLQDELQEFRPDVVWFDYTYLWPLYDLVKKAGVPIITQSNNFEPVHFLDEDGRGFLNYLKFIPKYFGERRAARSSDFVFAVTPKETEMYKRLGVLKAANLPTRGLPRYVAMPPHSLRETSPLQVFFMGSSYKVEHNKAAARQVIEEIAPRALARAPGSFVFHILGGKLPESLRERCDGKEIIHEGYVEDIDGLLAKMDVALIPSLMGAGMQQKVFEPLSRGLPTVTSPRAIAGYPFESGREYLGARSTEEFVEALLELRNISKRRALTQAAREVSAKIFSQEALDTVVKEGIASALRSVSE